ncbi:MAG: polysaccharide deacetylase, partial [Deltaproteobacteria bacterium]|nr:polysaccharide deacetylase [Deltaproteobacteria bacterium]
FRPYKIIEDGEDTGIVELPVTWVLDDAPHFLSNIFPYIVGLADPDKVYKIWSTEFDGAYAQGGAFILTCHPQIIGRYHRIIMLEKLIQYMMGHPDVWFTTGTELAQEWLAQQK